MIKRVLYLMLYLLAFTTANAQITSIAIVGSGVGGWPGAETNPGPIDNNQMTKVDADNWILEDVVVTGPAIKFRANNSWDAEPNGLNLGAPATGSQFPEAIGVNTGRDINIGVIPGIYTVKLNTATLAYSFEGGVPTPVIKIIGSAVPNGSLELILTSKDTAEISASFLSGTAKFEIDGILLSDSTFPTGTATDSDAAIPIIASDYIVKINFATGVYSFMIDDSGMFPTVKIVGSAITPVEGIEMTTLDGETFSLPVTTFLNGNAQFNFKGDVFGGSDFPSGRANSSSVNVPVVEGDYSVTVHYSSGDYSFSINGNPTIAIVGAGVGGWPGSDGNPGPIDINQMSSTDGVNWIIENLEVTGPEIKFRGNNSWNDASATPIKEIGRAHV